MHQSCKEIACGRKVTNGLRRAYTPFALGILLRFGTHDTGNLDRTNAWMTGRFDDPVVVILDRTHTKTFDRHFHIRLPCTNPHLTWQHIADGQWLTIIKGNRQRIIRSFRRFYFHQPSALLICLRADDILAPGCGNFYRLSRLCPSPKTDIGLLL